MAIAPDKGQQIAAKGDGAKKRKSSFAVSNPQCKICQLPPNYRRLLERMIGASLSQAEVMRHLNALLAEDYGPDYLNEANMSNHVKRHLSARETAIRKVYEERARQYSEEVETQEGLFITKEAALDAVIVTGVMNIASGATYVEPRELVQAIALKKAMEEETGSVATDELWRQFLAFQDAVKVVVTPEQRELIATTFEKNLQMTAPKELAATTTVSHIEAIEVTEEIPNDPPNKETK